MRAVSIVRFAKFGKSKIPSGEEFDWLVVLEEGRELKGSLTTEGEGIDEPGFLVLGMGMQLTMQFDGQPEPMKLKSRKTPRLEGPVSGWPPYNAPLALANGPIPYYLESDVDNRSAMPLVTVTSNEAVIGSERYPLLSTPPELTRAIAADDGTVSLTWTDTASEIDDQPAITSYHVYRNDTPGDPEGWSMIASLPATVTDYIDNDSPGGAGSEYLVLHAAELIFGYELESLLGVPQLVRAS